ncbi:hypothetical protein O5O45_09535 [Hahella aquimaris]|uniref:hypothetical protein n=1 Tax=Hahella sp. HNIBRBA332 TaxID=3015983 RepID=UPI00273BFA9C|nr:hypothetical protein [Hahella sp. HNIBRBA332]WLQ16155.1 hypothetical protein O5O45_09535 [Hahella sp. HNIBRBA332]
MMAVVLMTLIGLTVAAWLWLALIAIMAVKNDDTLERGQKALQFFIILVAPLFGSLMALYLVNQYSPEAIPHRLIPWPFKSFLNSARNARNPNRDDNNDQGFDLAISSRQDGGMFDVGSDGGGGGGGD